MIKYTNNLNEQIIKDISLNGSIKLKEFYPMGNKNVVVIPHSIIFDEIISSCRSTNTNIKLSRLGARPLTYDKYMVKLNNYVQYIQNRYGIHIDVDENIYTTYSNNYRKNIIRGVVGVEKPSTRVVVDFSNLWIPEMELGIKLAKEDFYNVIRLCVPELDLSQGGLEVAYNEYVQLQEGDVSSKLISDISIINDLTNSVLGNIPYEYLSRELYDNVNDQNFRPLYASVYSIGGSLNEAKRMLYYNYNILHDTINRVRKSLSLDRMMYNEDYTFSVKTGSKINQINPVNNVVGKTLSPL